MSDERFRVGVLVKGIYFILGYSGFEQGQLGIISEVLEASEDKENKFLDLIFDYSVLVGDEELLMFEEEITEIKDFKPCSTCECDPCDCDWGYGLL